MRQNFLRRVAANMSPGDVERVKEIDRTYRSTATTLGLLKPKEDLDGKDLATAMRKLQIRQGH
jgi:hypothetical protein